MVGKVNISQWRSSFELVGDFHKKFGLKETVTEGAGPPAIVDYETFLFRYQFLQEELQELLKAYRAKDLPGIADALADLVYVALGTAHLMLIPFDEVFEEVQRANMQKERSKSDGDPRSKRASLLDVVKPEGWRPPDVAGVLARYSSRGCNDGSQ